MGNNQQKQGKSSASSNMAQLSQRSSQSHHHQKTNSMNSKTGANVIAYNFQNNPLSLEDQQDKIAQKHIQNNQTQNVHTHYQPVNQKNAKQQLVGQSGMPDSSQVTGHLPINLSQKPQINPTLIQQQNINSNQLAGQYSQPQQLVQSNQFLASQIDEQNSKKALSQNKTGHKKSNSMMNSKMAQILLKNAGALGQSNLNQQIANKQTVYQLQESQINRNQGMGQQSNIIMNSQKVQNVNKQQNQNDVNYAYQQTFLRSQTLQQNQVNQNQIASHQTSFAQYNASDVNQLGSMSVDYDRQQQQNRNINLNIQQQQYQQDSSNINNTHEELNDINNLIYSQNHLKNQMIIDQQQQQIQLIKPIQVSHKKQQSMNLNTQTSNLIQQQPPSLNNNLNVELFLKHQQLLLQNQQNNFNQNSQPMEYQQQQQQFQMQDSTKYSQVLKKQISSANQSNNPQKQSTTQVKGSSAQKSGKKQTTTATTHHQRTKSDTYHNRGSIAVKQQSQLLSQPQQKQQLNLQQMNSKRISSGIIEVHGQTNTKMLIEAHSHVNSRQAVNSQQVKNVTTGYVINSQQLQSHENNQQISSNFNINQTAASSKQVPSSTNHSKKSSYQNANILLQSTPQTTSNMTNKQLFTQLQIQQQNQLKKSQKDKYNELKAMYDDLLEKHNEQQKQIQLQQHQQQILAVNKSSMLKQQQLNLEHQQPQVIMNYNGLINSQINHPDANDYQKQIVNSSKNLNINLGVPQQSLNLNSGLSFDNKVQNSTPRVIANNNTALISQQVSQQTLNNQNLVYQYNLLENASKNIIQLPAKFVKQVTSKIDSEQLQPKTILKMHLPQGQSRKNASNNHKRSVSDGNEQLFKFKQQQAMQKFLYPQPSNQAIQTLNLNNAPTNSEETIGSARQNSKSKSIVQNHQQNVVSQSNIVPTPYLQGQSNHYRRVSDDYLQKQKKAQNQVSTAYQNSIQLLGASDSKQVLKNQYKQNIDENVGSDHHQDSNKHNTIDFNIKNFLLEMRNKHSLPSKSLHQNSSSTTVNQQQIQYKQQNPIQLISHQTSINNQNNTNGEMINVISDDQSNNTNVKYSFNPPSPITSNNNTQHNITLRTGKVNPSQKQFSYQHNHIQSIINQSNINQNQSHLLQQTSQKQSSQQQLQPIINKKGQQFAMIIEENSPVINNSSQKLINFQNNVIDPLDFYSKQVVGVNMRDHSVESLRSKEGGGLNNVSAISSSRDQNTKLSQAQRKNSNNKINQFSNKRSSSPNLELDKKQSALAQKKHLAQAKHKRVKSDIPPELPKKQSHFLGNYIAQKSKNLNVGFNNPSLSIQSSVIQNPNGMLHNNNYTINQQSSNLLQQTNTSNLGSAMNLYIHSDTTTPKKIVKQQVIQQKSKVQEQQKPFSFGIGSDMLYKHKRELSQQLDGSNSKKVVNVSIDLIKEGISSNNGKQHLLVSGDDNRSNIIHKNYEEDDSTINENISYLNDSNIVSEDNISAFNQNNIADLPQNINELGANNNNWVIREKETIKQSQNHMNQQQQQHLKQMTVAQSQNNKNSNSIKNNVLVSSQSNPYGKKGNNQQKIAQSGKKTNQKSGAIKQTAFSGGNEIVQRHDKYKKMLSKYENIHESGSKSNRKYTIDVGQQPINQYSVIHSSSVSPSQFMLQKQQSPQFKHRLSMNINDKPNNLNSQYKKQVTSKVTLFDLSPKLMKEPIHQHSNYKNLNKQHHPQQNNFALNQIGVNSNQKLQQTSQRQSMTEKQLMSQVKHSQQQNLKIQTGVNSSNGVVNQGPPNNSIVQTQETPRSSILPIQQSVIQNAQINYNNVQNNAQREELQQQQYNSNERLDTQDSHMSESNSHLTPRSRAIAKLIKHIKLNFRQTQQPPSTTVDFYRIGKVLGKGAFGKVNLALHKLSGKFAAVKSINKQYLSEEAQTKKVMQEVVILKRTRHRNIVRLYEFFETQKHIVFVIELCAGGDLLNYVRKRRRLKEDVAKSVFKQIIEGLGYCHSKSILHRDIKLDNILLDSEGEVKICDFGVSKIVKRGEIMTEQCGTPAYIAPEILRDRGYEGFAVDIWSSGVVLYAMLYGTVPFKANNMSELQKLIIKAQYTLKDDISEESRDLLTGLLEKDPLKRLTIEQILKHKWLIDAEERVDLFTQQEKDYIKNEFTYSQSDRLNRNTNATNNNLINSNTQNANNQNGNYIETDPFTEHMLDSTNNSFMKNQTSKSVILAPFNSTKSDLNMNSPAMTESMRQLLQSKRCLKFNARCRDVDRQYEINNNAELDNGVYHQLEEEENKQEGAIQEHEEEKKQDNKNIMTRLNEETDDYENLLENNDLQQQPQPSISKNLKNQVDNLGVGGIKNLGSESGDSLQSSFNKESSMKSDDEEESLRISMLKKDHDQQQVFGAAMAKKNTQNQQPIQLHNSSLNNFKDDPLNNSPNMREQSELQKLESMIYQQEDNLDNPYQEFNQIQQLQERRVSANDLAGHGDQILIRDEMSQSINNSYQDKQAYMSHNNNQMMSPRPEPQTRMSGPRLSNQNLVLGTAQTLIIDEEVLSVIEMMGYPRDYIIKCLNNNELNYATTGYYLLQNSHSLSFSAPPLPQLQSSLMNTTQNLILK